MKQVDARAGSLSITRLTGVAGDRAADRPFKGMETPYEGHTR